MKIVVTGSSGFVGHSLVRRLLDAGHDVAGLDAHGGGTTPHPRLRVVSGDLGDRAVRASALEGGCDAVVHLATVPGGAAEADPHASWRINIDAMYNLLIEAADAGQRPRIVYASSIAVFGDPLPPGGVDDHTPIAPKLIYGGHKAMMETAVSLLSERGAIDGVTVRLPGILARPKGPSGMKSAFMSDLFHALREAEPITCPVSPGATIWAQSVTRCVDNLVHALSLDAALLPRTRAVTLPAICIRIEDLVREIAHQCEIDPALVSYKPDAGLEAAFGAHPPLSTPAADAAGFSHDGDVEGLVGRALAQIATPHD